MRHKLWPALVAALLGVPIVTALLQRVPDTVESEFVPESVEWSARPVDLEITAEDGDTRTARLELSLARPETLLFKRHVRLLFATYATTPALVGAQLAIGGTTCVYRTSRGAVLVDNGYVDFYSDPACQRLTTPPTGAIDLDVVFRRDARLALWSYRVPIDQADPTWISPRHESANSDSSHLSIVRGRYVEYRSDQTWRRVVLLGYVWQVGLSAWWILFAVAAGLLLFAVGATFVVPTADRLPSPLGTGVAVAALALGIAMLYAVLNPPFQAADEPDHFLAFAQTAGREDLPDAAAALAKLGHVMRIHFHSMDRFRPSDIGHPSETEWPPEVFAESVAARSATTYYLWKGAARIFRPLGPAATLLGLRLMYALLFAVAVGTATALLIVASRDTAYSPQSIPLALLIVPTVPFFAMYVSEFAFLTSMYVCLGLLLAGLLLDGRRSDLLGLPLGVSTSLILASGRSALPLGGLLAAAMLGRCLLGPAAAESAAASRRNSLIFWTGFGIGSLLFGLLATPEFRQGLWPNYVSGIKELPDNVRRAADFVRQSPSLFALVAPLGLLVELGLRPVRDRVAAHVPTRIRSVAYGAAALVLGSLLLSTVFEYPTLATIESSPPTTVSIYARDVLSVAMTGFRIGNHDLLVSHSFWGGFGWIDTLLPTSVVSMLVLLTAAALVFLLVRLARSADLRRLGWLVLFACGSMSTLILYAASSFYLRRNLMGRYLVGYYVTTLGIFLTAMALQPRCALPRLLARFDVRREWLLLAAAATFHGYSIRLILTRYF